MFSIVIAPRKDLSGESYSVNLNEYKLGSAGFRFFGLVRVLIQCIPGRVLGMKFSIVITTYNRISLLKRAVETALGQTVPCEVIVADDGSSDGTEAYIRSLGDRVIYHRNSSNLGHSGTMNAGVQLATGDWIKPVDDDDYLAFNCIEQMAKAIALRPQAVICSCQAAQVDTHQVELSRTRLCGPGKAFYIPQEDIHYGMLLELVPFGTPIQVAFRRDAFLQSGGWDSNLDTNYDDIDSWVRITQFGDAVFVNQCLAYRTIWPGALNQKFSLLTRLNTNILVKQKIHHLVHERYRSQIPALDDIEAYLKLHWSFVALKQGKMLCALKIGWLGAFSPMAWKLLLGKATLGADAQTIYSQDPLYQNILRIEKGRISASEVSYLRRWNFHYLRVYFRLRCSIVALKQGKVISAIKIVSSTVFSPKTWKLLSTSALPRKTNCIQSLAIHDANNLAIQKIYELLSEKEQPDLEELQAYFKLRWGWLAFKQGKVRSALRMAFPAMLSPVAWKILAKVARLRQYRGKQPLIRKFVLIEL